MMYDLVIIWRVLETCNLGCPFCEFNVTHHFSRVSQPNNEEILSFAQLLYQYKRKEKKEILISWLGGEPLLWKGIFEVSAYIRHELGIHLSITTNGTQLHNQHICRELVANFDGLTISIDGLGSTHDYFRKRQGLFNELTNSLKFLYQEKRQKNGKIQLRANVLLHSNNIHDFEDICATLAQNGVTIITLNPLYGKASDPFFQKYKLRKDHINIIKKIYLRREEIFHKYGIKVCGENIYFDRLNSYILGKPIRVDDCDPGTKILFIDQAGRLGPCSFIAAFTGARIQEIRSIEDIEKLPYIFRSRIQNDKPKACSDCCDSNVFGKFIEPNFLNNTFHKELVLLKPQHVV